MSYSEQQARAQLFRELHHAPPTLILPNVWDVGSARLFEEAGFQAIGTSSAGVAVSLGYPDGECVPRTELMPAIRRITRLVHIPLTVDIEAGLATTLSDVAETVRGVIGAGGVGINLEDATGDDSHPLFTIAEQIEKIQMIRRVGDAMAVPLVINARTDVYHVAGFTQEEQFAIAVERATAYREAGADCLFVPFVSDGQIIARLAAAIRGPLNILAVAGTPSIPELESMGVARVSIGSGPYRAALGLVRRIADELHQTGTYTTMTEGALPYPEMNELVRKRDA